jgi:anti-anti-sigma regulatory factor
MKPMTASRIADVDPPHLVALSIWPHRSVLRAEVYGTLVRLEGKADVGTAPRLRRALNEAGRQAHDEVTLDLRALELLDGVGISELVGFVRRFPGCTLVIEHARGEVHDVLESAQLGTLSEIEVRLG